MALLLDMDGLLASITSTARGIVGVRFAYDHDEWPNRPPGMFKQGGVLHLTSFPEEGNGWTYRPLGIDLSEYEIEIPLYTLVIVAANVQRSRNWMAPFIDRYRAAYDTRTSILTLGSGNTGSLLYTGGRVVRSIPDWPEYDGYYMLRHTLMAHVKGSVSR